MADVQIVTLPNPYMIDWKGWADFVVGYNPGLASTLDPQDEWQTFALRLGEVVPETPRPDTFADWRAWAAALKLVMQV